MHVSDGGDDNDVILSIKTDIAEEYFVHKLPNLIRWIFFLPTGLLGSIVIPLIINLINALFFEGLPFGAIVGGCSVAISSIVTGLVFVYLSAFIAPKAQNIISYIMLGLIILITCVLWVLASQSNTYPDRMGPVFYGINSLLVIFGAIAAVVEIREKLHK